MIGETKWIILALQIVAIVVLLAASEEPSALGVPKRYIDDPPDKGFTYTRVRRSSDGTERESVWVPGLTDRMNEKSKKAYDSMKREDSAVVWKYRRQQVAQIIQYTQDHPKATCETHLNGTATMASLVCRSPSGNSKSFPNAVATQFDKYLDDAMITPVEGASLGVKGYTAHRQPRRERSSSQATRHPASQRYYAPPTRGRFGERRESDGNVSSAYSSYISSHVAPGSVYSNRDSGSVFSSGGEEVLLLNDQVEKKKSQKLAPAQTVKESKKPAPNS